MSEKLKYLPNCITVLRMIGTLALLFTTPMKRWFYIIYAVTGVTDVVDGYIARKFNLTSDLGARLDSIADLLFYAVMLSMIMPVLWATLPNTMWYFIAAVIILRISAYLTVALRFRKFASSHSVLNKMTGVGIFAIPFVLLLSATPASVICGIICFISGVAALTELIEYLRIKNKTESA